jgi:hypothetical protein
MKNIKTFKIFIVLFFLIIVIPYEKISFILGLALALGIITNFFELLSYSNDFVETFVEFSSCLLTLVSCLIFFKSKKILVVLSLVIQYVFLFCMFKMEYLNYWCYYVPTSIYLVLSLFLIIKLFVLKTKDTNVGTSPQNNG